MSARPSHFVIPAAALDSISQTARYTPLLYDVAATLVGAVATARPADIDRDTARALADAGYMPVSEYDRLCRERGWSPPA